MKENYFLTLILLFVFSFGYSQISSFPHTTTFESSTDISTTASDVNSKWVTRTDGDWSASEILWTRATGSTVSTNTGPTSAQSGDYYVYVETSGSTNGDDAELSCNYDFTGKTEASISFNYHNWGVGSGVSTGSAQMALYVYDVTAASWSSALWSSDPGLDAGSDTWYSQTVDLSAYDGRSVQIWFTLNSRGWASDGALDNIEVTAYTPNGVTAYYVDDTGDDTNNGLTEGAPFATLAKALSVSDDAIGVTINVGAGTYTEEDLTISRSNITISGAGSSQTIFDGDLDGRFATISANNTTIENLQIKEYGVASSCTTNGSCGGGAILVGTSKTGFVVNNAIFDGNITDGTSGDGGAIEFLTGSTSTINSTIFRNNKAGSTASFANGRNGGATKGNGSCTVTFNNCLFHENVAQGYSGAHTNWMNDGGSSTFNNCTIEGNTQYNSSNYGAVSALYGTVNMRNSIIRNTIDGSAGAGSARDIYFVTGVNLNYGVEGSSSLSGSNSTSDPLFTDTANDDYTLQTGSPAIDVGSSTYAPVDDINDFSRPQGQADDLGAYEHRNTWDGSTDTDWSTTANWSENIVPVAGRSPIIADVTNQPVISSDDGSSGNVSIEDITINSGAELSINSGESLTLSGNYTNSGGTFTLNSGSSIIVTGTSSGNIIYNRTLSTTNWYLISSPVVGQDIDAFVSAEGLASGTGNNIGLSDYSNSIPGWTYYQSGASGTGNFTSGDGRSIKLVSAGDITFTGTINTSDVGIGITTSTNGFNLVGNPYPSFIAANNSADGTNNILKVNETDNDFLTEATLWFWNQGTNSYDQINHASSARHIAPGQGFFVSSNGANTLSITEAMQSHQGTDTFQRLSLRPEIQLTMTNGTDIRNTDIFYIEETTTGWDNGYDSTIFGGVANEFAIYTHLLSDSQGQDLGIQSLPPENYENMVIPIGINAISGIDITIDATITNFSSGMNVYLEDKEDNSFTLLAADSNFTTTLISDLNGIGRFYLHTTSETLSSDDVLNKNNISLFISSKENLRIVGVQNGSANIHIYNILGKEVLRTSFEGTGMNDIQLPILTEGVYIVNLSSDRGSINKKIIIK